MTGDGLSRGLSDMWRSVVLFLPSALAFLAIVFVGYLLARLARTLTTKALRRAGFDRAVQQGPAGRLIRPGTPSATDVCARLAFFVVLLFALQLAFGIWGSNPASELINALISWLPQVFVAIVIVVVTTAIARAAHDLTLAVLGNLAYARVLAKAVTAVIVTLGVIAGLDQIGIATSVTRPLLITILATVAGVIIVGVGGGLIRPMQQRWEGWLDRAATESAAIRSQARAYAEERARQAARSADDAAHPRPAGAAPPQASPASPGAEERAQQAARSADDAAHPRPAGPVPPQASPASPGAAGPPGAARPAGDSGPAGGGAVAAESGSSRPAGHPDVDPAASPVGADPVQGAWRAGGITSRDARRAGADDVAAEARRASGADFPERTQAVAAGAAVAGVQGQDGAGEPGETSDRERATSGTPATADDGTVTDDVTAGAPSLATAASSASGPEGTGSDFAGPAARAGSDSVGLAAGDGSEVVPGAGAGPGSAGLTTRDDAASVPPPDATVVLPPAGRGDVSDALSPAGDDAQTADAGAAGPETYPEEDDDWAWEARWAEEERQARERGGEATQIVAGPAAGMADDRPHLIPGFDSYDDRPPVDDDDPTIFVHIGTAETTLLTPGVRPASPSADPASEDDDPTVPGHRLHAATVPDDAAVSDNAEPIRSLGTSGEPDQASGASAFVRDEDEPTTTIFAARGAGEPTVSLAAGGPSPADSPASLDGGRSDVGEPTTSFVAGGPVAGEPTVSLAAGGADVGEPTTSFVAGGPASAGSSAALAGDGADVGEPTTAFVTGGPASGEPTVSLAAHDRDAGEPTTAFVVHGSGSGAPVGAGRDPGSDPDDLPTTFITRGTDSGDVTVVRNPEAGVGEDGEGPEAGRPAAGPGGEEPTAETTPGKGSFGK
jgi:hypothetical protein